MIKYFKKQRKLIKEVQELQAQIEQLEKDSTDPIALVNAITNNGIEWYDYRALPREQQVTYHSEAKSVLETAVFKNEINSLINEWSVYCLRGATDWQSIRDMRMQTSALDLLRKRLAGITHPTGDVIEKVQDPHNPI